MEYNHFNCFQLRELLLKHGPICTGDLKEIYEKDIEDGWLPETLNEIKELLLQIPDITANVAAVGTILWFIQNKYEPRIEREPGDKKKRSQKRERYDASEVAKWNAYPNVVSF